MKKIISAWRDFRDSERVDSFFGILEWIGWQIEQLFNFFTVVIKIIQVILGVAVGGAILYGIGHVIYDYELFIPDSEPNLRVLNIVTVDAKQVAIFEEVKFFIDQDRGQVFARLKSPIYTRSSLSRFMNEHMLYIDGKLSPQRPDSKVLIEDSRAKVPTYRPDVGERLFSLTGCVVANDENWKCDIPSRLYKYQSSIGTGVLGMSRGDWFISESPALRLAGNSLSKVDDLYDACPMAQMCVRGNKYSLPDK